MRCGPVVAALALPWALLGCPDGGTTPGEVCDAHLDVRVPSPDPLLDPTHLDLAQVRIDSDEVVAFDDVIQLFGLESGGLVLPIVDESTGEPPLVPPGEAVRVALSAFGSLQQPAVLGAVGRTASFACRGGESPTVPLYIGPADSGAATAGGAQDARIGARLVLLDPSTAAIVGGGTAGAETTQIYDHASGTFCTSACVTNDPPQRADHSMTPLGDGRFLVFGGRDTTGTVLSDAWIFDGQSRSYTERTLSGVPVQGRANHAAVLLDGFNVAPSVRGKVLIVGGCSGPCGTGTELDTALLVDPSTGGVEERFVGYAVYDARATLTTGGSVVVSGGRDATATPLSSLAIFDDETSSFGNPLAPCVGADLAHMCAGRADHTAVELDDGNILIVGGETVPVTGVPTPPVAEVFLLADERSVPVGGLGSLPMRRRHTATMLACDAPPCDLLLVGGTLDGGGPATPARLRRVGGTGGATPTYDAVATPFAGMPPLAQRVGHRALRLGDGTLLLVGGVEPQGGQPERQPSIFSPCVPAGDVDCPAR